MAKDGEKVIGYIRLKIADLSVDLVSLYVDPKYTGMGVGSQLWAESKKIFQMIKKYMLKWCLILKVHPIKKWIC